MVLFAAHRSTEGADHLDQHSVYPDQTQIIRLRSDHPDHLDHPEWPTDDTATSPDHPNVRIRVAVTIRLAISPNSDLNPNPQDPSG